MGLVTAVIVTLLILITLAHVLGVMRLLRILRRRSPACEPDSWPRVSILIGLREADPYLSESLRKILTQDYPDYEVHFVVDSVNDPAWNLVGRALVETGAQHAHREEFLNRPEDGIVNCTTSKQVQALRKLGDDVEVVAMADGDLVPHRTWLKDLVRPLVADSTIGATFGQRWFLPKHGRWGSLARAVWNQAAVFEAVTLKLPWGGCFAIRADAIRNGDLVDAWSETLAFDASAPRQLKQQGLSVEFVPNLLMPNVEECSVSFTTNWVRRQLTWTKLYHTKFWAVVAQTGIITTIQLLVALLLLWAVWIGATAAVWMLAGGIVAHFGVLHALSVLMNLRAIDIIRGNGGTPAQLSPMSAMKLGLAVPLAQLVQRLAVWQTLFERQVTWRGLTMEVVGPQDIRVIGREAPRRSTVTAGVSL